MKKLTIKELMELKGKRKIILTTAFDFNIARACELAGIDIIVTWAHTSDSMEELKIVLDQVRKGAPNVLIGAGIPRNIAYISEEEAVKCALAAQSFGADIIYSSGMDVMKFRALAQRKIPCVGHVGLLPVNATWFGGMRAVGKNWEEAVEVYNDTIAFYEAGAIGVEMECVPHRVAAEITKKSKILTFSMGSGDKCDGQFVFSSDLLGSHNSHYPRHAKKYRDFFGESVNALRDFVHDAQNGVFPAKSNMIDINEDEYNKFYNNI